MKYRSKRSRSRRSYGKKRRRSSSTSRYYTVPRGGIRL